MWARAEGRTASSRRSRGCCARERCGLRTWAGNRPRPSSFRLSLRRSRRKRRGVRSRHSRPLASLAFSHQIKEFLMHAHQSTKRAFGRFWASLVLGLGVFLNASWATAAELTVKPMGFQLAADTAPEDIDTV